MGGPDDIERRVMALIARERGRSVSDITTSMEIERDLGCTGDDAVTLMEWMQQEFDIDMSGFQFDRHFDSEGQPGWPLLLGLIVSVPISVFAVIAMGMVGASAGLQLGHILGAGWFLALVYIVCFLLVGFAATFLPQERARRARKIPVTVQHLIDAAWARTWPL